MITITLGKKLDILLFYLVEPAKFLNNAIYNSQFKVDSDQIRSDENELLFLIIVHRGKSDWLRHSSIGRAEDSCAEICEFYTCWGMTHLPSKEV